MPLSTMLPNAAAFVDSEIGILAILRRCFVTYHLAARYFELRPRLNTLLRATSGKQSEVREGGPSKDPPERAEVDLGAGQSKETH
jgi:hypothetical protein